MKKTDVVDALHTIKEANQKWALARARFNSATDTLMFRLIHEAAKNFMSAEDIASASGWSTKKVKEHMRGMHLDPRDGAMLLSRKAAEALATNSALMGIEPSEMDLMSPLAYLPMGDAMKRDLAAAAASQVHEVELDYDEAKKRIEVALMLGRDVESLPIVLDDIPDIAAWLASEGIK